MSTDYPIHKGDQITLEVHEGSGRFDVDVSMQAGYFTIAGGIDVEQLAEIGLKFLQVALYNCADVDKLRAWLHTCVNEVDFSGTRTPFPKEGA